VVIDTIRYKNKWGNLAQVAAPNQCAPEGHWSVAGGGAKRNPPDRITNRYPPRLGGGKVRMNSIKWILSRLVYLVLTDRRPSGARETETFSRSSGR
jgi:hypothetical protein